MPSLYQTIIMLKRIIYKYKYKTSTRDWKLWVFGEWFGKKCNDSSLALANYVVQYQKNVRAIWIARKDCMGIDALDTRISIVEMDSPEAIAVLKKAGVLFVNEGLQDLSEHGYNYSNGGIIVNLWHGVPWKKIGIDSYKKEQHYARLYAKLIFFLQSYTYFPTTSDRCSQSLMTGFMVKNRESLIPSGLPRNQLFFDKEAVMSIRKNIVKFLKSKSTDVDENTRIIAYMPTFRDNATQNYDFNTSKEIKELTDLLEEKNVVIIQKAHIVSQNRHDAFRNIKTSRIITWNECSAQELLAASDVLITDYSSCFFDFLLLNRPIIHFLYDYEYYSNVDRGLYYKKEDVVCGDIAITEKELIFFIKENLTNPEKNSELRKRRREEYLTYESANSCKIITEFIKKRINNKGINI